MPLPQHQKTKPCNCLDVCPIQACRRLKQNKPEAYHVYSMRQAIEEGFILDVLKNYTNYKVVYKLKQKIEEKDNQVDAKKAKIKLNQWVRLHDHNISQKVQSHH